MWVDFLYLVNPIFHVSMAGAAELNVYGFDIVLETRGS
jgi:hypothetical protein